MSSQFNDDFSMYQSHNVAPSEGLGDQTGFEAGDSYTTGVANEAGEYSVDNGG